MNPRLVPLISILASSGALAAPIDFNREVRPILSDKCFKCHGFDANHRKGKLRLDVREEADKGSGLSGQLSRAHLKSISRGDNG